MKIPGFLPISASTITAHVFAQLMPAEEQKRRAIIRTLTELICAYFFPQIST